MSAPPSTASSRLADHVRACRVGDQMIFLDLVRSKYFGMAGPHLAALSAVIGEGSQSADFPDAPSDPALLHDWLIRLRAHHLLSNSPAGATARRRPRFTEPVASLNADDQCQTAATGWCRLVRLWQATFVAATWLRRRSLADIANRVTDPRARHSDRSVGIGIGADAMLAAVASYMRLRPFALTSHDRCLNDSLTLIHFLAGEGLFPQWVIGVRIHPFAAHSWVQSGGVVLNDLAERVRNYRPILVV